MQTFNWADFGNDVFIGENNDTRQFDDWAEWKRTWQKTVKAARQNKLITLPTSAEIYEYLKNHP